MVTPRRRRAWADTIVSSNLVASATSKHDLLAGLSPMDTKTVSRILVDLSAAVDPANVTSMDVFWHIGIGVTSKEAYDLETLPDPDAVADYPQSGWVYVGSKRVWLNNGGTIHHIAELQLDLRGQRKVDRGVLFLTMTNIGVNGGGSFRVLGRIRALCLT